MKMQFLKVKHLKKDTKKTKFYLNKKILAIKIS